jgi:hypothetical protein
LRFTPSILASWLLLTPSVFLMKAMFSLAEPATLAASIDTPGDNVITTFRLDRKD